MSRFSVGRDPYWLTARFNGRCRCGGEVKKGQRAFYYPNGRHILCAPCSDKASKDFDACQQDEAMEVGGW